MVLAETTSLPGLSQELLADGFAFFDADPLTLFNDIGDIWGSDESLEFALSLDADFFADLPAGLPVERAPVVEERMTIQDLARAVREHKQGVTAAASEETMEADEEGASIDEVMETDVSVQPETMDIGATDGGENQEPPALVLPSFAAGVEDKKKTEAPAIWDFAAYPDIRMEPPRRHAVARQQKDVGLLDILQMKPTTPTVPTAVPVGSARPSFAQMEPPKPKKPAQAPKRKKKAVTATPVGSATLSFFDMAPSIPLDEAASVQTQPTDGREHLSSEREQGEAATAATGPETVQEPSALAESAVGPAVVPTPADLASQTAPIARALSVVEADPSQREQQDDAAPVVSPTSVVPGDGVVQAVDAAQESPVAPSEPVSAAVAVSISKEAPSGVSLEELKASDRLTAHFSKSDWDDA